MSNGFRTDTDRSPRMKISATCSEEMCWRRTAASETWTARAALVQAFQLEGLPASTVLAGRPAVARLDTFADEFEDSAFDRTGIDELGLGAVVIVGGGDHETDLIAGNGAFGDGKVELVAEHFSGD